MPSPFKSLPFLLLTTALLTACSGEVEDTRPGQPVKSRQTAFKEILKSYEPMGVMLREDRYQADKFLALATEIMSKREAPWSHFGPDTNYPPTKSTPEVWSQAEQFEAKRRAFFTASDALLAAAQAKDKQQAFAAHKALYETCQDCHKTFKVR